MELELGPEADVTLPHPCQSGYAAVAVAICIQIPVLHVPSFVRVAPKYLKLNTSSFFHRP